MQLWQDVRFGLRSLVKTPGLTLVCLIALALGIGVNATVFSLTDAVLFKGFPFDKSDRVVYLLERNVRTDRFAGVSFPDFRDWRASAKSFVDIAAFQGAQTNVGDDALLPEVYPAALMTSNSFRLVGQKPVLGRDFLPEDEKPGAPQVAILTYGLWERRYGKDPNIIGRTARMNGVPTTIVGVMPPDFQFPFNNDLWLPLVPTPDLDKREARALGVLARLGDGVDIKTARAEMTTIAKNLEQAYPADRDLTAVVRTYSEQVIGPFITTMFLAMMAAVTFVLLIATANVANLQLARAVKRSREISIRIALGASRRAIIQQLLVESVILSFAGGAIGALIAVWGMRAFDLAVTPMGKPRWITFSMNGGVILYLLAVSTVVGVLFGLAPALRLSKLDVNSALKDGARGAGGLRTKRLANILVVSEMALAVLLLAGAGLMVRSFLNISRANLGIDSSNVLTMRVQMSQTKYRTPEDQIALHDRLVSRLGALPGVEAVAVGTTMPTGGSLNVPYELDGSPVDDQHRQTLSAIVIGTDFFKVWRVRPVEGRAFLETDTASTVPVMMVNQAFAAKYWPNQDPIGKRLRVSWPNPGSPPIASAPWLTVVGVVPNIVHNGVASQNLDPVIYVPFKQKPFAGVAVMLRTQVPPGTLANAVRREIQSVDADMPIFNLWTMEERLLRNYWFQQLIGILFAIFAAIALVLSGVGLYAVIANSVNQRTQEIGVRMAMGASARNILRLVFAQGMRHTMIGLIIGLAGSLALTRVLKAVLTEVSPSDPVTLGLASTVLVATAVLGCFLPARRAMAVNPVVALYHE